jgi:hypothetical protein
MDDFTCTKIYQPRQFFFYKNQTTIMDSVHEGLGMLLHRSGAQWMDTCLTECLLGQNILGTKVMEMKETVYM